MNRSLALGFVFTLLALVARAADPTTANEVLDFSTAKNAGYDSYSTAFVQTLNASEMNMKLTGTLCYKKPMRMRMEMTGAPQHMLAVIGPDRIVWQEVIIGGMTNVMKVDLQHMPTNHPAAAMLKDSFDRVDPQEQLTKAKEYYAYTLLPAADLHGQPMYVLAGKLRADVKLSSDEAAVLANMGQQKLFIGQQDGFLHRLEQLDQAGTNVVLTMEFTDLKLNASLTDDLFIYKPAVDANIIDLSQMMLQMMGRPSRPMPVGN